MKELQSHHWKVLGMVIQLAFVVWTFFATLETGWFLWTSRCGGVILSFEYGLLTASKMFTCTPSSGSIAWCGMNQDCPLEMLIHRCGNWDTLSYTCNRWYFWRREMRWIDMKQDTFCNNGQLNLRMNHWEYEMHLSNDYYHTLHQSHHLL
jgi:hypothetical protein